MKHEPVAITEYVKKLGYEDSGKIANRIKGILDDKENFKDYLFKEERDYSTRPEKARINHDGKILVANLAVLTQFQLLFGRAERKEDCGGKKEKSTVYPPYRYLKKDINKSDFTTKVLQFSKKHNLSIRRANESIKNLSIFANSILTKNNFDITQESLRDLMDENRTSSELLDLGNSFELGAWNELLALQEKLDSGDVNSDLHLEIAEKLLDINEVDQAIESLNEAVKLDPENGIAWAIYAKTLLPILISHREELHTSYARIEFSNSIANPITSEEHWLNERIEESSRNLHTVRESFIEASINALTFWPHWENVPHRGDIKGKKNYQPNLNLSFKTAVNLKRADIFCVLINTINVDDFKNNHEQIIEIIRSYQMWSPELYPLTNIHNPSFDFEVKILEVLSWISKQDIERAIITLVKEWNNNEFGASKNLDLLKSSGIKKLFWNYLGKSKFSDLYSVLEEFVANRRKHEKLETICELELFEIKETFSSATKKFKQIDFGIFTNMLRQHQNMELNADIEREHQEMAIETLHAVKNAASQISGWENYLSSSLWERYPFSSTELPLNLLILTFIAPLIELANGRVTAINIMVLDGYAKNSIALKNVISFIDSYVVNVNELLKLIPEEALDQKQKATLMAVIGAITDIQEEILQDETE